MGDSSEPSSTNVSVENEKVRCLRILADRIGLEISGERTSSDILTDINLAIENSRISAPCPLDAKIIESVNTCLSEKECLHFQSINEFLKKLQKHNVYAFPKEIQKH
jgi:hypothetical protein